MEWRVIMLKLDRFWCLLFGHRWFYKDGWKFCPDCRKSVEEKEDDKCSNG